MKKINYNKNKRLHEIPLLIDDTLYYHPVSKNRAEENLHKILTHPHKYKNPQFLASFFESLLLNMRFKQSPDYRIKMKK